MRSWSVFRKASIYAEMLERSVTAAKALQFTILTACRTSEVLGITLAETDWEARTWTIPPERMKSGLAHRVPVRAVTQLQRSKLVALHCPQ